jgi:histone H1/5
LSPFIKKYLKNAVASGELLQTKGKGASGSFKLATAKTEKNAAPARGRAVSAPKVRKQSAAKVKKAKAPKKAALKSTDNKCSALVKIKESPSMAKKVSKVPTKKPKAPCPKTAAKPKAPKKTSPKKKWELIQIGPFQSQHFLNEGNENLLIQCGVQQSTLNTHGIYIFKNINLITSS